MTPAVPILEEVLAAFVCGTSVSPQPRTDTTSEDTSMNKFSAAHVQRGSHASAAHMSRGSHVTGAEEPSWNASARPARSTDAEISFGTSAHGAFSANTSSNHFRPRRFCPKRARASFSFSRNAATSVAPWAEAGGALTAGGVQNAGDGSICLDI